MRKSIGIIGGLGPLATVKFLEILNENIDKNSNKEFEIVVINDPTTPDRTEYILDNTKPNPLDNILKMVKKLDKNNVDVIVMPCNTASYFYKEINNATQTHFINIVYETVKFIEKMNIKKIGLLATEGTIKSGVYKELLDKFNIECLVPKENDQKIINEIIYGCVKQNKKANMEEFYKVSNNLQNEGAQIIILGCTELSALKKIENIDSLIFIDAMDILAKSTLEFLKV